MLMLISNDKTILTISEEEYQTHASHYDGICLACKEWTSGGVEPDARNYECETCQKAQVMGAEEALMFGYIAVEL